MFGRFLEVPGLHLGVSAGAQGGLKESSSINRAKGNMFLKQLYFLSTSVYLLVQSIIEGHVAFQILRLRVSVFAQLALLPCTSLLLQ